MSKEEEEAEEDMSARAETLKRPWDMSTGVKPLAFVVMTDLVGIANKRTTLRQLLVLKWGPLCWVPDRYQRRDSG